MISKDKDSPKIRRILLHWGCELVDKKKIKSNFKLTFFCQSAPEKTALENTLECNSIFFFFFF